MIKKLVKLQKGITGLETAIILIAFVVVAAVFAYTVLSAGLFSTQKSQEAVYSGLQEAQSTLEIRGGFTAVAETTGANGQIGQLEFTVSDVLGGQAIDFTPPTAGSLTGVAAASSNNTIVINYTDNTQNVNDLYWTFTKLGSANANNLLESGEKFEITVGSDNSTSGAGNLVNALSTPLSTNTQFDLSIVTPGGATLNLERTTPAWIDQIMNLR